jgi:hypothetical protein
MPHPTSAFEKEEFRRREDGLHPGLYGDYEILTLMAKEAPKGPPIEVFWGMQEDNEPFYHAMNEYVETLGGADPLAEYEEIPDGDPGRDEQDDIIDGAGLQQDGGILSWVQSLFAGRMEDDDVEQGLSDVGDGMGFGSSTVPFLTTFQGLPQMEWVQSLFAGLGMEDDWFSKIDIADPYIYDPFTPVEQRPRGASYEIIGEVGRAIGDVASNIWDFYTQSEQPILGQGAIARAKAYEALMDLDMFTADPTKIPWWKEVQKDWTPPPPTDELWAGLTVPNEEQTAMDLLLEEQTQDIRSVLDAAISDAATLQEVFDLITGSMGLGEFGWPEVLDWMNQPDWAAYARAAGKDPDELREWIESGPSRAVEEMPPGVTQAEAKTPEEIEEFRKQEDVQVAMQAGGVPTGGDILNEVFRKALPSLKAPSYLDQFSSIFDNLPGSQRIEAQRGKAALFNDAETLFYLTTDWGDRAWMFGETDPSAKFGESTLNLEETERVEEEAKFAGWVNETYLTDPRDTRFGPAFYDKVRGLRDEMAKIKDKPMSDLYDLMKATDKPSLSEAKNAVMNRFVFMEPNSSSRLAKLVGMYNVHPGADNWLKTKMMGFYSDMMNNWTASGRNSYDFIEAFVKDRPAMDSATDDLVDPTLSTSFEKTLSETKQPGLDDEDQKDRGYFGTEDEEDQWYEWGSHRAQFSERDWRSGGYKAAGWTPVA